jgi:hypothetical protein
MDVVTQLLVEHSKVNTQMIMDWVGDDAQRFAEVMAVFLGDDHLLVQRSAWVVGNLGLAQPQLLAPYKSALLQVLRQPLHPAVQRNGLRLIAETGLRFSEDEEGQLVELAFDLLADPGVPVAIRAHAMQVIANLCGPYPDLATELQPLLEDALASAAGGLRSRARRVWKQLKL